MTATDPREIERLVSGDGIDLHSWVWLLRVARQLLVERDEARAQGETLREELRAAGLPETASAADLVRHHRGNAGLAAAFEALAQVPPSGRVLPAATIETVRDALTEARECLGFYSDEEVERVSRVVDDALAALPPKADGPTPEPRIRTIGDLTRAMTEAGLEPPDECA